MIRNQPNTCVCVYVWVCNLHSYILAIILCHTSTSSALKIKNSKFTIRKKKWNWKSKNLIHIINTQHSGWKKINELDVTQRNHQKSAVDFSTVNRESLVRFFLIIAIVIVMSVQRQKSFTTKFNSLCMVIADDDEANKKKISFSLNLISTSCIILIRWMLLILIFFWCLILNIDDF